jgi:DNA-binding CsgD family transcriptional regulator
MPTATGSPAIDPHVYGVALEALAEDTRCIVCIIDVDGTIHWANRLTEALCNAEPGTLCATHTNAIFPPEYVAERLELIREAIATGVPVVCEGICWGLYRRSTFRPIPTPPGEAGRVLIVCRPKPADEIPLLPDSDTARRARFNDLGPLSSLTERELEVLDLIGRGLSTAEIARYLHRSIKTIEWHRVALGEKLGATNRVGLARIALNAGLSSGPLPPVRVSENTGPADARPPAKGHN